MASRDGNTQERILRLLVLTDCPIAASGGSERFLRNLLGRLPADCYQVTLVQLCKEPPPGTALHDAPIASLANASFLPISAVYRRDGLRALKKLRRLIVREGFHAIQSQHENSDVLGALLPRGPLRAARISNRRDTGFLKSARLRQLSRLLNRRFDVIVAPSAAILDAVQRNEGATRGRMRCIPNGVDTERFRPVDFAARARVRSAMGYAQDDLLVGCVADFFAVKRHQDLIDAFARVHAEMPLARLILVGDGPLREPIESQVRMLGLAGAVRLLGSRRDVNEILSALDLFVLASETEGLSNAILEAQACGLPVIATNIGGNPDLVKADCGQLVEARCPEGLSAAILQLLRDPASRARLGAAARARTERDHSLSAMTLAYEALYRELRHAR
jgi:glycosyltransferase involved in cell wall biosynthesis